MAKFGKQYLMRECGSSATWSVITWVKCLRLAQHFRINPSVLRKCIDFGLTFAYMWPFRFIDPSDGRLCVWEPQASPLCAEDYLCLLPSDQGRRKTATQRRSVPWRERPFSLRCFSFLLSQTFRLFPRFRAQRQNDLLFIQMHFLLFICCCLRRGIFFLSVVSTLSFPWCTIHDWHFEPTDFTAWILDFSLILCL